ncbi:hypothetical protein [Delftia acidovorans]|uniref:hypothetical protein n=1 Tax=Delftia acidovorans TaxID=80866 RepID=UPI00286F7F3E|nr:hypothetical protein [Delftia acidovorans]
MFVLISRFKVAHYNAQQCKDIIMPVPIHAAVMLGHALGARLGKPVQGVALVLHEANVEQESLPGAAGALLANKRGATTFYVDRPHGGGYASTSLTPAAMSYQMHATANGCFSMALDLGEAQVAPDDVKARLMEMRFAGGCLQEPPQVQAFDTQRQLLQGVRPGYLVMDAAWRAAIALESNRPAHVFLHRHEGAYIVPAVVGYHMLTELSNQRQGIRRMGDMELEGHAFAESITGLIEFRHINRFKHMPETALEDIADDELEPWSDLDFEGAGEVDPEVVEVGEGDAFEAVDGPLAFDAPNSHGEASDSMQGNEPQRGPGSIFWKHGWSQDGTSFLIQQL